MSNTTFMFFIFFYKCKYQGKYCRYSYQYIKMSLMGIKPINEAYKWDVNIHLMFKCHFLTFNMAWAVNDQISDKIT